ncbi:MAG TPA: GNAT family N-acetyltransferase [Blastocatellia bacterium]|nr:GNAT family N-acetyltransferase [Blastocatellia bacterium]
MTVPEIETKRLLLRRFTPDDLEAFSLIVGDPEVMRYYGAGVPLPKHEVSHQLSGLIEKYWQEYRFGRWAIVYKESGDLIGFCGLRISEGTPELNYLLAKAYWFAGLATEAARACLRYGFEELRLPEVIGIVRPENLASIHVLKKLGMRYAGRQEWFYDHNFHYYSVSAADYQPDNSAYQLRWVTADDQRHQTACPPEASSASGQ